MLLSYELKNWNDRPAKPAAKVRTREKHPNKPNLCKKKHPPIHQGSHKHQKLRALEDDESISTVSDSSSTSEAEDDFYDYEAGAGPKGRGKVCT